MKFVKMNNVFFMSVICLLLIVSINVTYSKFTYSKELTGQVITIKQKPTIAQILTEKEENGVTLDTNVDFSLASSSTNGVGLMMRDGTQNDKYPIVYYRGNINNNNVIFGGFCWLIVRTTETGGIKLLFNGPIVENSDGTQSCSNYSGVDGSDRNWYLEDVLIANPTFNSPGESPVYVGYMYNDEDYIYSKSTLTTGYISHLLNNNIDQQTGRHVQNLKDSLVKGTIDAWYETNIAGKSFESLLEDTVWCNDRSVISETYSIENYANETNLTFYFAARTRLEENAITTPSLVCNRNIDKFTVERTNGNGDLTYPIGLLTADEVNMAGLIDSSTNYLSLPRRGTTYGHYWTLSPNSFGRGDREYSSFMFGVTEEGNIDFYVGSQNPGVRPSVSLNKNATISSGEGTFLSPYIMS